VEGVAFLDASKEQMVEVALAGNYEEMPSRHLKYEEDPFGIKA